MGLQFRYIIVLSIYLCVSGLMQAQSVDWVPEHTFTSGIEGPVSDQKGNVYAVNYGEEGTIGVTYPDGSHACFVHLPKGSIGNSLRIGQDGWMYVADYTHHNILKIHMQTKEVSVFVHEPRMNQPNDIAFGPRGMLYVTDPDWKRQQGQLWLINPKGETTLVEPSMGTTNGIAVSADGKRLYVNESIQLKVWVYDICADGSVMNKRLFHSFEGYGMDGMKCDVKGNVYVCRYDKGTIACLNARGELVKEIQLKGKRPTNLTFAGKDNLLLYVTIQDRGCFEIVNAISPGKEW